MTWPEPRCAREKITTQSAKLGRRVSQFADEAGEEFAAYLWRPHLRLHLQQTIWQESLYPWKVKKT
jgi:hypothetical protein